MANFKSNTIWTGDNLRVMRGINSNTVDLLYIDHPFNSNRNYSAPVGSKSVGVAFKDKWTLSDIDENEHGELAERSPAAYDVIKATSAVHRKGMQSYLIFMAVRLLEMKRILKPTGSIYLHCDDTANDYLKLLMDAVFGIKNGIGAHSRGSEIIWKRSDAKNMAKSNYGRMFDALYCYRNSEVFTHNTLHTPITEKSKGVPLSNVWTDISQIRGNTIEKTGYTTQKPLALLDRIIRVSSNEGDVVFDPFCGSATTLVAAHNIGRQWIGCDLSPLAVKLVNERILEIDPLFAQAINPDGPPNRDDVKGIKRY